MTSVALENLLLTNEYLTTKLLTLESTGVILEFVELLAFGLFHNYQY
jgi:hypothetical protein